MVDSTQRERPNNINPNPLTPTLSPEGRGRRRPELMSNSEPASKPAMSPAEQKFRRLAAERILVLDGAMGTMIQELKLDEEGYRGARFDAWNREVRGQQ